MRGYLIDTNVISEYNRELLPHAGVVKWLDTTPEASKYVIVLTLAEIEKGILRMEEGKRRRDLQRWFDRHASQFKSETQSTDRGFKVTGKISVRPSAQTQSKVVDAGQPRVVQNHGWGVVPGL